jgi:hypothetical protein
MYVAVAVPLIVLFAVASFGAMIFGHGWQAVRGRGGHAGGAARLGASWNAPGRLAGDESVAAQLTGPRPSPLRDAARPTAESVARLFVWCQTNLHESACGPH